MNFATSPLVSAILLAFSTVSNAEEPIDIGSRRELFVGNQLVGSMDNVRFRLHEPRKGQRPKSGWKRISQNRERPRSAQEQAGSISFNGKPQASVFRGSQSPTACR